MGETASLSIRVTQEGVDQTAAALGRLKGAGTDAETSMGALALKIAGFSSLANVAVDITRKAVSGLMELGKEAIVLAASFEKSRVTWGVLVGDMDKGAQVFEKIKSFADKTPLSFEGLNQAATTIKGFGAQTNELIPTLSKLGDLAMGDNNKLQSLALVYGQVMAQGKAKTQDLYQFINAGVPIFNLLADSMGKSAGEIKGLAADGAVTFEEIDKAITKATSAGGQFHGMMVKLGEETAAGKWSTAQDNFKANLADLGTRVLPMVTAALDAANREMERWNRSQNASKGTMDMVSLSGLVSSGNDSGVFDFLSSKVGKSSRSEVQSWITEARKANPLATNKQNLALQQAQAMLELFSDNPSGGSALGAPIVAPPVGGGGGKADGPYYNPFDEQHIANASWANVRSYQTPWASHMEPFSSDSPFGSGDGATSSYGMEQNPFPEPSGHTLTALSEVKDKLDAIEAREKTLREVTAKLNAGMKETATTAMVSSFQAIGKALAAGASGAATFEESMVSIVASAASSMGQLMMTSGLEMLIASGGTSISGWALFVAGGGLEIIGGYMGADSSSSSNGNSTAANSADLLQNYLDAESFNSSSRNKASLSGYAHGGIPGAPGFSAFRNQVVDTPHFFRFASGGVFGEAGPEAAVPLVRTASGDLGVRTSGSGANVSIVINNNAHGTQASSEETTDAEGQRIITVTVEKIVEAGLSKGRYDKALGSRYGTSAQGRKVSA